MIELWEEVWINMSKYYRGLNCDHEQVFELSGIESTGLNCIQLSAILMVNHQS